MRGRMREMLAQGDIDGVVDTVEGSPRELRRLTPRLWDDDAPVREAAAAAIAEIARRRPSQGRDLVRRFVWAMNEESGTNGAAVLPALAAIARTDASVLDGQLGCIVTRLRDGNLRPGLLGVLAVVATASPALVAPLVADVRALVADPSPDEEELMDTITNLTSEVT